VDTATLSGGSWIAGAPLTNLQDKRITRVARSTDATAASTRVDIDLGSAKACQGFALINHNCSAGATWRVTGGTSAGASDVFDSGSLAVVQMSIGADILEWSDSGWWEGMGDEWLRNMHPIIYVHSASVTARYWRFAVTDTANTDGYVQFGRPYIGPVLIPTNNDSYGRGQGFADFTTFERGTTGARFARLGRKAKKASIALEWLSYEEVRYLRGISRQDGVDADVLFCSSATDAAEQQEYGFLGTVTDGLESLQQTHHLNFAASLSLEERL